MQSVSPGSALMVQPPGKAQRRRLAGAGPSDSWARASSAFLKAVGRLCRASDSVRTQRQ
jgi:hypothetical protein